MGTATRLGAERQLGPPLHPCSSVAIWLLPLRRTTSAPRPPSSRRETSRIIHRNAHALPRALLLPRQRPRTIPPVHPRRLPMGLAHLHPAPPPLRPMVRLRHRPLHRLRRRLHPTPGLRPRPLRLRPLGRRRPRHAALPPARPPGRPHGLARLRRRNPLRRPRRRTTLTRPRR